MNISFNPDSTHFISDPHFNHAKIIKHCNRPFKSVEEMNETIIGNTNRVVKKTDTLFILGDQGWPDPTECLKKLNGKKNINKR